MATGALPAGGCLRATFGHGPRGLALRSSDGSCSGTYVLSAGYYDAYYRKAQQVRRLIQEDYRQAFTTVDCILMPTTPTTAFGLGEKVDDPLQMYLSDVYTVSANLAGIPAISIPCGTDSAGLPIGAQILGRHLDEVTVLRVAHGLEEA